jgi:CBS domain-containing protein
LERSLRGSQSAARLLAGARENPLLQAVHVGAVMSKPVETLPIGLSFAEAVRRAQAGGKGAYPVVDEQGRMAGLCTRTDFYNAFQRLSPPETPIADIMRRPVLTVRISDTLTTALLLFLREPIKRLVVVADDDASRPVGMITPFDVVFGREASMLRLSTDAL